MKRVRTAAFHPPLKEARSLPSRMFAKPVVDHLNSIKCWHQVVGEPFGAMRECEFEQAAEQSALGRGISKKEMM